MQNWVEKYRPKTTSEIINQEEAIKKIKEFIDKFPQNKKALLLNGPPGIGKTTLVHAISNETKTEIFELNASDLRNKSSLNLKLRPVLEQQPLFKKNKIILVDEVDGLSGTKDRGGVTELISLIENTKYPIICIANDSWSKKLSNLRKKVDLIELNKITPANVKIILKNILKKENKKIDESLINKISIQSSGDLRSAINDLEALSAIEKPESIEISKRNEKMDIFHAMKHIFQDKVKNEMLQTFDKVDMQLDEIILWIEKNIPKVYKEIELIRAYERLGEVDLFKGRIYKQQYWRFLVYENIFLSYGISQAKGDTSKEGFYKYEKPSRILKIWLNNVKHTKRKIIAQKYANKTHVGQKRIMSEWNEIKNILKNKQIQKELRLEQDEIDYIMKY